MSLSKKELAAINREVNRINKLPKSGLFTLIHHRGPMLELSHNIMERVDCILTVKPENERLVRLHHIRFVKNKMLPLEWQEAYAKWQEAYAKWQEAYAKWQEAYAKCHEAYAKWQEADAKWQEADAKHKSEITALLHKLIPNCQWDGEKIKGTP